MWIFSFFFFFNIERYQLRLTHRGYFRNYDSRTDATLSNAVASAGLFFIATLTPKTLDLVDSRSASKSGERSLLSAFYAPQEFYEAGAIDRLIVGATGQLKLYVNIISIKNFFKLALYKRVCTHIYVYLDNIMHFVWFNSKTLNAIKCH